jgi:hypothetical protein
MPSPELSAVLDALRAAPMRLPESIAERRAAIEA